MGIMDLSINQEAMGVQSRFGNQVFKLNKIDETDVKENNNLYNSRKTDTDSDSGSLFRDGYSSEKLQVDPSLFSYSSFKKAMDLRTHNRMDDENRRTIFDDADYFAKNFFYKLLPITFEQVDETIIHTEHNYSLFSLNSESEGEEDCSRTMDYSQIKEKNYKRRRTKFKEGSDEEKWDGNESFVDSDQNIPNENESPAPEPETVSENSVQPLDLSTAPPVQEQKTDNYHRHLKEHSDVREENLPSKLKCIQVTITRPDEKENYQPCDMFLNDIARLVPRLINNDCFEIDILDRTGDRHDDFRKHRLYYIIAESTWQLFQSTRERVILTNDHTLGPPVKKIEKDKRPTFLVFDQFSLAKCLADYCEEIGGCFEYTCVEEGRESEKEEDVKNTKMIELVTKTIEVDTKDERVIEMNVEEMMIEQKIQDDLNIESKEAIMGYTPDTKNSNDEGASSNIAETVEIISKEAENECSLTETKSEKFEEQNTKAEEGNTERTEWFDMQINEVKTNALGRKEIVMNAEMPLNVNPKERKTRKRLKKRGKRAKTNVVNRKKIKEDTKITQLNKICTEEPKVEAEEAETDVINNETEIIAVDLDHPELSNTDTKETKETEIEAGREDLEKTKPGEMSFENEKMVDQNSREIKANETRTEEIKIFDGGTKSKEENVKKATEVRLRKRTNEKKETKPNKKNKKFKKSVEVFPKEAQASVRNIEETKMDNNEKGKTLEIKEADTKEMKRNKRCRRASRKIELTRKDQKTLKKERKSAERAKKSEKSQGKSILKRTEVEKARNLPPRIIRRKVKSESDPPLEVPNVKTRSKSTSESETSQKPNKEIQKPKNTVKVPPKGVETKVTSDRRTRSGKRSEERKQDVKENERGKRGRKRKMEEEERVASERCLRSRGGKENTRKVGTFDKRKKR